jgi:hypothetical protein
MFPQNDGGALNLLSQERQGSVDAYSAASMWSCTFTANQAFTGGAVAAYLIRSVRIADSTFTANVASSAGRNPKP